jgi:MarR family 2-MHQ and catechol resistance regulon transcriptional repressor
MIGKQAKMERMQERADKTITAPGAEDFLAAVDTFARAVRRARGAAATTAPESLTLSQYGLLEPLLEGGTARVRDLAEAAGVTAATATRILDALERRGLVSRDRSAEDRRSVRVGLTDAGRPVLERRAAAMHERERVFYAALAPADRAVAPALLRQLAELIDDLAALH